MLCFDGWDPLRATIEEFAADGYGDSCAVTRSPERTPRSPVAGLLHIEQAPQSQVARFGGRLISVLPKRLVPWLVQEQAPVSRQQSAWKAALRKTCRAMPRLRSSPFARSKDLTFFGALADNR